MRRLSDSFFALLCSCLIFLSCGLENEGLAQESISGTTKKPAKKETPNNETINEELANENKKKITTKQLEEMYSKIRTQTTWNIDGPMLWGYFFIHHEPSLLEKAKRVLVKQGYTFVELGKDIHSVDNPDAWILHVQKIETHTPESLDKRNNEFYAFAREFGLDSYDGMGVEPAEAWNHRSIQ